MGRSIDPCDGLRRVAEPLSSTTVTTDVNREAFQTLIDSAGSLESGLQVVWDEVETGKAIPKMFGRFLLIMHLLFKLTIALL